MSTRESDAPYQEVPSQTAAPTAVTPGKALLILAGVVVVVAGFILLTSALGIPDFWAGFLFLLYWAGIQHTDTRQLLPSITGAFFGVLLLYLSHGLPDWFGDAGLFAFVGLLIVVIYCQILGLFAVAINMIAMLYLTVGTIPAVQEHCTISDIASALVLGIVYFVGIILGGKQLMAFTRNKHGAGGPET